jgi:hypothetical protein
MNRNRMLLAGLAAGVFWIVVDFVGHGAILGPTYQELGQMGVINTDPAIPFLPLLVIANLLIGIGLAWTYASVRPRLGAGPKTALMIGLVVFLILIPPNLSQMAWSKVTDAVKWGSVLISLIQAFGASFIAGWLYKE